MTAGDCGGGPDLARLQAGLARYLAAERRDDADPSTAWVAPRPGRGAAEQLAVYRQLVRANHTQALQDTYPACRALVGDDYFKQLGALYFARYPTADADLNRYGGDFAGMLAGLGAERDEVRALPCLADLARLEWAWQRLNGQADPAALDFEALAAVPAERHADLCFYPNPTLGLLETEYAVHGLWDDLLQGGVPAAPARQPTSLLVWRSGGQRRVRRLEGAETAWVRQCLAGDLGGANGWGEAAALQTALVSGWISGFSLDGPGGAPAGGGP